MPLIWLYFFAEAKEYQGIGLQHFCLISRKTWRYRIALFKSDNNFEPSKRFRASLSIISSAINVPIKLEPEEADIQILNDDGKIIEYSFL